MNKDKMVKVRLLNAGGFIDLRKLSFPIVTSAIIDNGDRVNGVIVNGSDIGVIRSEKSENTFWFSQSEYELITEEEQTPPQQTIEQLLFTRKEYFEDIDKTKKMILDIDQEIKGRLNSAGWDY